MKNQRLEDFSIEGAGGGGGGGGCFLPGTWITTTAGFKKIEDIQVGDVVACYPEDGSGGDGITTGTVYQISKHPKEDNNANLFIIEASGITLQVTGNHYLLSGESNTFEYAANFEVGDSLVLSGGEKLYITSVTERPIADDEFVYNFEVDPHHTYIANGLRVHNGGGGSSKGGSSGGAARAAREAANTLSSSASAVVMEVVSEGEIVGLVNGAQSIYFDGTPVQNSDLSYNYDRFKWDFRTGQPDQTVMPGFAAVETTFGVGVPVTVATGAVERQMNASADAVRVTIGLGSLHQMDPTNGDINGYSFGLAIDHRVGTSGPWVNAMSKTVSGKTMTPYEESYRIERPAGTTGAWQVRVRRTSSDDTTSNYRSQFAWSHYVELQDKQLKYNNTAYVGIKVDAKSTGGNLPKRSYRVKGIKVRVPSNYNPTSRTYYGTWNGAFKTAWTDNPAWVLYDLLTNQRYGMGKFIEDSMIDQYSFYDAAKYNDELVTVTNTINGLPVQQQEPRFTFNNVINTRQDAWKLIQAVASSCRAVVYYGSGKIKLIQDRPVLTSAYVPVNKTDVIDGMFEYASTSLNQRHTVVQVSYNNKFDRYLPSTITVEDTAGIARYGYNIKEVLAYGATTEGQARRLGLWTIATEMRTTESVKFRTSLNLATRLSPGMVVKVMDEDIRGVPFGGRVESGTTTSVTVDRDITFVSGQNYVFEYVDADGVTIKSATLSAASNPVGTRRTIVLPTQTTAPTPGTSWILTSQDFGGKLYRIYTVSETTSTEFEVTAFAYDPDKYTLVDQATNPETWTPFQKDLSYCPAPTNMTFSRETTTDSYGRRMVNLRINWSQTDKNYINNYLVSYRRGVMNQSTGVVDGREIVNNMMEAHTEFIIPNAQEGTYEVRVAAVNLSNVRSPELVSNYYNDLSGGISPMGAPINLTVKGGGTTWTTKDLTFVWQQNPGNTNTSDGVFKSYYIEILDPNTNAVIRTDETTKTEYIYNFDVNRIDNGDPNGKARRTFIIRVYNKDSYNRTSAPVEATFTNPVPGQCSVSTAGGYQYYNVNVTPPSNAIDVAGYVVAVVPTTLSTPVEGNVVYKGPNSNVTLQTNSTSVIVRAGCYDTLSDNFADIIWSDTYSITVVQTVVTVDSVNNYKFFGLLFNPNSPSSNYISWGQAGVVKTTDGLSQTVPAGNAQYTGQALYLYYDWNANQIIGTPNLSTAVGLNKVIVATYYGNRSISTANGDAYIDGGKILAQTVGASQIIAGSITANEIAANTITAGEIASGTITSTQIAAGGINADRIAAGTITADRLVANTAVITDPIQVGDSVVENPAIADGAVDTNSIALGAVSANSAYIYSSGYAVPNYDAYPGTTIATTPTFTARGDKMLITVNIIASWDDGVGGWAIVDDGVQASSAIVGFRIHDNSDGSIDLAEQQTIGFAYIEGYWVTTKNSGDKFMLKSNSQRWQNSFDKTFTFNCVPGKTYYITVHAAKQANAKTTPSLVPVAHSSSLTIDEVTITRLEVKR